MGLDYECYLYFYRQHLWDSLLAVAAQSQPHHPPTLIHLPDGDLEIPLMDQHFQSGEFLGEDTRFHFIITLYFDIDAAVRAYLEWSMDAISDRSPPDRIIGQRAAIGGLDLIVYPQNPFHTTPDIALFRLITTGTHMSLMFSESPSVRRTFSKLLVAGRGICGIMDKEYSGGELFWLKGKSTYQEYADARISPLEILP